MIEDFEKKMMEGLVAIGFAGGTTDQDIQMWPFVLSGHFDNVIQCFVFYHEHKKEPDSLEELQNDEITTKTLKNIKDALRQRIHFIFKMEEEARLLKLRAKEEYEEKLKKEKILQELKERNKPHEWGTVAEIAQRYNISKSEVRRRKAEDTLKELLKPPAVKD